MYYLFDLSFNVYKTPKIMQKVTKTLFLDIGWKRWVAEDALRGAPAEELTRVLVKRGFDEAHVRLEVHTALSQPENHFLVMSNDTYKNESKYDRPIRESYPAIQATRSPGDALVFKRI